MKVFISWSGPSSKQLALTLRQVIPDALQNVEVWMSNVDIPAGERWAVTLASGLQESRFGILCLTPDNLMAPWLLFEAGALARSLQSGRVVPYSLGVDQDAVPYPLAQFQGCEATRDGSERLFLGINEALDLPLPRDQVKRIFSRHWRELNATIRQVRKDLSNKPKRPDHLELLEEIVSSLRREPLRPEQIGEFVESAVPLSLVWRTVHSVTSEEICAFPSESLKGYFAALKNRLETTQVASERDYLNSRMKDVEHELARRTNILP
jgi:hypothetical protein